MKSVHRNLKVQFNLAQDENMRLRTRIQAMALEFQKNEKEMEIMMRQLQGDKTVSKKINITESFLVTSLKK
jgi:hypothetical protein